MINKIKRLFVFISLHMINAKKRAAFVKKINLLHHVGENCAFFIKDFGTEPYLIKIHNNVEIASGVKLITHDDSVSMVKNIENKNTFIDSVGSIEIFDNCFIGAESIIMPNTKIGPNSIVAAGSVVTKKVREGEIVGGVPAKKIDKTTKKSNELPWKGLKGKNVIKSRITYFWGND